MWSATWAMVACGIGWSFSHSGSRPKTCGQVVRVKAAARGEGLEAGEPVGALLGDEERDERDHAHAAVDRQPGQHVVGDVARVVGERERATNGRRSPGRRPCPGPAFIVVTATCDRSTSMPRRCISATTVAAEADRPPQSGCVGRRVGPADVVVVGQRQVADAEGVQGAEHAERAVDAVPALRAEQRGDLARRERRVDVVGAQAPAGSGPGRRRSSGAPGRPARRPPSPPRRPPGSAGT